VGVTLAPCFNKKFAGDDLFYKYSDGKDLLYGMSRFDEICAAKGATLFSTLCGPDEDEMEAMAAELKEGETLKETWFTCADGLRTVTTIIKALESEKQWLKRFRAREVRYFLDGLRKLEEALIIGKKKKAKFFFLCC
jgi:hypothetical protein